MEVRRKTPEERLELVAKRLENEAFELRATMGHQDIGLLLSYLTNLMGNIMLNINSEIMLAVRELAAKSEEK